MLAPVFQLCNGAVRARVGAAASSCVLRRENQEFTVKDRFKVILSIGLNSAGVHFYKSSLEKTAFEHFVREEAPRSACANVC